MNLKIVALCLLLGACVLPTFEPSTIPPPEQRSLPGSEGAIIVDVPENRGDRRAERADAAAECAKYGRVERRRGDGEYSCVAPPERQPREIWRIG